MNLLTQNSKLKKTSKSLGLRVFNFGIPAYKSASGKLTCPFADACVKFCYAKKGAYIWSNVQPAFEKRYQLSKTDDFVNKMNQEIIKKKPDYVRVHDSGDYYSNAYLRKWLAVAIHNSSVRFYSYTNCVSMFKNINLPDNYDMDFHIDYDNRIAVESMSFHNADELVRGIYNKVEELFAEATAPEDKISIQEHLNQD